MVRGSVSGCINHPGIEAIGRCKQCGKPFCSTCRVEGPSGNFCSSVCKDKHEAFIQRVHKLESMKKVGRVAILKRLCLTLVGKSILLFLVVVFVGFVAAAFNYPIPILSGFIDWLRALIRI